MCVCERINVHVCIACGAFSCRSEVLRRDSDSCVEIIVGVCVYVCMYVCAFVCVSSKISMQHLKSSIYIYMYVCTYVSTYLAHACWYMRRSEL